MHLFISPAFCASPGRVLTFISSVIECLARLLMALISYMLYLDVREAVLLFSFPITHPRTYYPPSTPHIPLMSHSQSTSASSTHFQLIFNNALKAYKKRTKKDLLKHPLADQLEACDSPSSILEVLQQQVQELNESQRGNGKFIKWLDPTVKVLHAFSDTVGGGVSLVCPRISTCPRFSLSYILYRHSHL